MNTCTTSSSSEPLPSHGTFTILYSPVAGWYLKVYVDSYQAYHVSGRSTTIVSPMVGLVAALAPEAEQPVAGADQSHDA